MLIIMSTRLQIIVNEEEAQGYKRAAARQRMSLSQWARKILRNAARTQPGPTAEEKLSALDRALECHHSSGDIDQLLREIEKGRDLR